MFAIELLRPLHGVSVKRVERLECIAGEMLAAAKQLSRAVLGGRRLYVCRLRLMVQDEPQLDAGVRCNYVYLVPACKFDRLWYVRMQIEVE